MKEIKVFNDFNGDINLLINKKEPFIIKRYANTWIKKHSWDFEFFKTEYGFVSVEMDSPVGKSSLSLLEFVDRANTNDPSNPIWTTGCTFHNLFNYDQRLIIPENLSCWYQSIPREKRKQDLSYLNFCSGGSRTNPVGNIWNSSSIQVLLKGKKKWLIASGEPFDGINHDAFVSLASTIEQEAGDLLFIPSDHHSAFVTLEQETSWSYHFINESNYQNVLDYFQANNKTKAYKSIEKISQFYLSPA